MAIIKTHLAELHSVFRYIKEGDIIVTCVYLYCQKMNGR